MSLSILSVLSILKSKYFTNFYTYILLAIAIFSISMTISIYFKKLQTFINKKQLENLTKQQLIHKITNFKAVKQYLTGIITNNIQFFEQSTHKTFIDTLDIYNLDILEVVNGDAKIPIYRIKPAYYKFLKNTLKLKG